MWDDGRELDLYEPGNGLRFRDLILDFGSVTIPQDPDDVPHLGCDQDEARDYDQTELPETGGYEHDELTEDVGDSHDLPDDVPEETKHLRNQLLLADLENGAAARNARFRDTIQEVLVEGVSKRNPQRWTGRTTLNKVVNFLPQPDTRPGDLLPLRITRTTANSLFGEIVVG